MATVGTEPSTVNRAQVTWGPRAAIMVTVAIYFAAQILGSVVLVSLARNLGHRGQLNVWLQQIWPQFLYVLLVEGVSLGLLWWFLHWRKAHPKSLGLRRPKASDLAYTGLGAVIYFPLLIAAMAAVKAWLPSINLNQPQDIGFTGAHGPALALVFVSLCLLPPLAEEILVRGFLYSGLKKGLPKAWAVLITCAMFAAAHLEFGSGAPLLWSAAIDTFLLSLVLIYLREKTSGLWSSIGLHVLKNSLAFMALFLFIK